jgi:hypothetical protein
MGVSSLGDFTGTDNTAVGHSAMGNSFGNANFNTAVGSTALLITTGFQNIGIGEQAGRNLTGGSYNIDIGSQGVDSDSGVIRIGDPNPIVKTFVAGVTGVNVSGANVVVNSAGQLGINVSSERFKEDIHDMTEASSGLMRLRPVTFRYKKPYEDGSKPLDYGLIAEEVAQVYPDLVVKGRDGEVETVQYQKLTPMMLNELQKQSQQAQSQQETVTRLTDTIKSLQGQVAALQKTVERLLTAGAQGQ